MRYARTVREATLVPRELDEAIARAPGEGGEPGPAYLDFPTDTLRATLPPMFWRDEHMRREAARRAACRRPSGSRRRSTCCGRRSARSSSPAAAHAGAGAALTRLLDALPAAYLDTGESRGLVPDEHPSVVTAMRGAAMTRGGPRA